VFWKAIEISYKNVQKCIGCSIKKNWSDLHVTFKWFFKVKPMVPSYGPLETIQLSSKTFFSKMLSFWKKRGVRVVYDTLYIKRDFVSRLLFKKKVQRSGCKSRPHVVPASGIIEMRVTISRINRYLSCRATLQLSRCRGEWMTDESTSDKS